MRPIAMTHPIHHIAVLVSATSKIVTLAIAGTASGIGLLLASSSNTTILVGATISAFFPTAGLVVVALINHHQTKLLKGQNEVLGNVAVVGASTHQMVNSQRTDMLAYVHRLRLAAGLPEMTDEQVMAESLAGIASTTGAQDAVTAAVKATEVDPATPKEP